MDKNWTSWLGDQGDWWWWLLLPITGPLWLLEQLFNWIF